MATANAMSVKTFIDVVPQLPANISILLRGDHGIGKSQIVKQVGRAIAQNSGIEMEIIDRRISQMSEGDMVGLPSTDGEVTRFNPPDWYKRGCLVPVILFLDEMNRGTHEVMQACFQIVLDRELNGWRLHPETRVFSAVNTSSAYTVNEIDPALLDRFWVVDLRPDLADWLAWARGKGQIIQAIIDFIAGNEKWLDPPKNAEAGNVHTSRRSWERLSHAYHTLGIADDLATDNRTYPVAMGFLGVEATIAFNDFVKTYDSRIAPKDILANYPKFRERIQKLGTERQNALLEKVSEYVTKNLEKLDDKQGQNIKDFMNDLPGELRVTFWTQLVKHGTDKFELARSVHKWCAHAILDTFGVPPGKAGVGIAPNIPSFAQKK